MHYEVGEFRGQGDREAMILPDLEEALRIKEAVGARVTVLAVEAACAAGRTDELERLRAGFARRWPSSTAKAKVERMCR